LEEHPETGRRGSRRLSGQPDRQQAEQTGHRDRRSHSHPDRLCWVHHIDRLRCLDN
jgi:hypothetical protein